MPREDLYKKFGPMLIEALALVMLDEINALRASLSLPLRTKQQLVNALKAKLDSLSKYDWMNDGN